MGHMGNKVTNPVVSFYRTHQIKHKIKYKKNKINKNLLN